MSYIYLEHATDAFIEVNASSLEQAFEVAAQATMETMLSTENIEEKQQKTVSVTADTLHEALYNWLEAIVIMCISEGFAASNFSVTVQKNHSYDIKAIVTGEELDLQKHGFKVEVKSPTYHLMEIDQQHGTGQHKTRMQFLLDL